MENTTIKDDELFDMQADFEITKHHDKVARNQLTAEEKKARDNMNTVLNMPLDDFLSGKFDNLK